ncbi:hypothetical protein CKM354_000436000 [Cercospora kikuchii]|uniref:NAD-dependent epimerase/dehydratase domain-containing protein n=1 Tax=Cercospora kikuchii TaxID=84275 RepID=A0A9P3FBF2_9PEZI|nr:uncharacterized protein CKM354_000436000 [Cercospora kikuchii]GIZ41043.1 hypothetical protein CKM354_000436000 [Cercospora kikuchii]
MAGNDNNAIPAGSLILVTGINGYVASHVADQLLKRGYHVRGTARSAAKLEGILKTLRARNPGAVVEGVVIEDMQAEGAFSEAMQAVAGVAHLAADLSMSPDPNVVIPATVTGVKRALEAAAATSSVKRVVYTSSVVSLPGFAPGVAGQITADDWNEEAVKAAWAPPPYDESRILPVYSASKTESEQEAWKYVKEQKPSFVFNTVLPALVWGPVLEGANMSSAGYIYGVLGGDERAIQFYRSFPVVGWHTDVEDSAILHVAALLDEDVKGERIFAFGEPFSYQKLIDTAKKINPSKTDYPEPTPGDQENRVTVDTSRGVELLKKYGRDGFKSLEQSTFDQVSK